MEGWFDLGDRAMHWLVTKPAISPTQVRHPNHYTTKPSSTYSMPAVHITFVRKYAVVLGGFYYTQWPLNVVWKSLWTNAILHLQAISSISSNAQFKCCIFTAGHITICQVWTWLAILPHRSHSCNFLFSKSLELKPSHQSSVHTSTTTVSVIITHQQQGADTLHYLFQVKVLLHVWHVLFFQ